MSSYDKPDAMAHAHFCFIPKARHAVFPNRETNRAYKYCYCSNSSGNLELKVSTLLTSESDIHCPWWAIDSSHTGGDLHVVLVALGQTGDVQCPHSMTVH